VTFDSRQVQKAKEEGRREGDMGRGVLEEAQPTL
jgi:hypothetical protein